MRFSDDMGPGPGSEHPLRRRALPGLSLALLPAQAYEVRYTSDEHRIGFALERQSGVHAFASDRARPFVADPWRLAFTPARCEVFSASPAGGEYLVVSLRPERLDSLAATALPALRHCTNVPDPAASATAFRLRRLLLAGTAAALPLEELAAALVECIVAVARCDQAPPCRPIMPRRRLARVLDTLHAEALGEIRLATIARAAEVSEGYLARSFKATTGLTLHQAVVEIRLAAARRMIESRSPPPGLAAVALECGFSSHAHMTTAFRRALGITPCDWRAILGRAR